MSLRVSSAFDLLGEFSVWVTDLQHDLYWSKRVCWEVLALSGPLGTWRHGAPGVPLEAWAEDPAVPASSLGMSFFPWRPGER